MIKKCVLSLIFGLGIAGNVAADQRGPVTNLPMPRFVSMKADEGNIRRGPSLSHKIDWVLKHEDTPLQIVGEYGHWRRVKDVDGQGGWMHFRLLSGVRTVLFTGEKTPLRRKAYDGAEALAFAEAGVIARLGECQLDWCKVRHGGLRGWVKKGEIWGVFKNEIRD